jgi:hypothetical protein
VRIELPYKPHPKQAEIHRDSHRFKVIVCGRRFGKSVFAINHCLKKAFEKVGRYWIVAPTYGAVKSIYWRSLVIKWIPKELIVKKNDTDMIIALINGSTIELKGADNYDALRGAGLEGVVLDEYADMAPNVWTEIIRQMLLDSIGWAVFIGTPRGFNHFFELYQKKHRNYRSFRYTSYDNPYLDKGELEDMKDEYSELGEAYYRQEIMAEFTKPIGTVYVEWNIEHFKDIPYDETLPLHLTFDWGVNDPTSMVWIQPTKDEIRVIDCEEFKDSSIDYIVQIMNSKPYKKPDLICGDPAGKARSLTTGLSPIDMLAQKGVYVRTKDGITIPDQIRMAHTYIKRLWVSKDAKRFRDCLINYRYPTERDVRSKINKSIEKPIHDEYSHQMRAWEYWAVNYQDIINIEPPKFYGYEKGLGGAIIERWE